MRYLADENFSGAAVELLRSLGHDVVWVREDARGSSDPVIVARASAEQRVILTHDKDFGELAFRLGLPATSGIVLVRLFPPTPVRVCAVLRQLFAGPVEFRGDFVVVEADKVRRRSLPAPRP